MRDVRPSRRKSSVFLLELAAPRLLYFPYPHGLDTPQGPLLRPLQNDPPHHKRGLPCSVSVSANCWS